MPQGSTTRITRPAILQVCIGFRVSGSKVSSFKRFKVKGCRVKGSEAKGLGKGCRYYIETCRS